MPWAALIGPVATAVLEAQRAQRMGMRFNALVSQAFPLPSRRTDPSVCLGCGAPVSSHQCEYCRRLLR